MIPAGHSSSFKVKKVRIIYAASQKRAHFKGNHGTISGYLMIFGPKLARFRVYSAWHENRSGKMSYLSWGMREVWCIFLGNTFMQPFRKPRNKEMVQMIGPSNSKCLPSFFRKNPWIIWLSELASIPRASWSYLLRNWDLKYICTRQGRRECDIFGVLRVN